MTAAAAMGYPPAQINAPRSAYNTSCTYNAAVPSTDRIFAHGFDN
jgi:hypothetical protein